MVNLLLIEADEELFVDKKELKILDMAAGTGGMLATAKSYIRQLDTGATVRLLVRKFYLRLSGLVELIC